MLSGSHVNPFFQQQQQQQQQPQQQQPQQQQLQQQHLQPQAQVHAQQQLLLQQHLQQQQGQPQARSISQGAAGSFSSSSSVPATSASSAKNGDSNANSDTNLSAVSNEYFLAAQQHMQQQLNAGATANKRSHSSSSSFSHTLGGGPDLQSGNNPSSIDAGSRLILDEFTRAGLMQSNTSSVSSSSSYTTEPPPGQRRRGPKPKAPPGMQKSCGIRIDELRAQRICRVLGVDRVYKTDVASLIDFSLDRLEGHALYVRQNGISGVESESLPLPESRILPSTALQESINVHSQTAIIWKRQSYHHAERVAKEMRQTKYKRQYKHAKRKREMRQGKVEQESSTSQQRQQRQQQSPHGADYNNNDNDDDDDDNASQ
ncbi:Hypothetical Protein FCC1311_064912 [Hondaea fermentalgiana]|uniref:Uncharacterized protein n=1 Tax=Hondaea fermentalgiana TaxID=2315210 RepID=A0A2R5GH99_9STRA|nr:Hypothetical Protein FCC1311_064912 [Hondaea fermentalgiana]|eukprot:GBG30272.1 Hypothetical Protein FCC1311_064912 [Hondaea fermentalgiana]